MWLVCSTAQCWLCNTYGEIGKDNASGPWYAQAGAPEVLDWGAKVSQLWTSGHGFRSVQVVARVMKRAHKDV